MLKVQNPRHEGGSFCNLSANTSMLTAGQQCAALQPSEPGWLSLPTDCILLVFSMLSPRDLCAVSCCCRDLREPADSDIQWKDLFTERFPALVDILGFAQPDWWCGARWKLRYASLLCGAQFTAQVYNREEDNVQEDFLLSCYDATLQLARPAHVASPGCEPTFIASYPAMGKMPAVLEQGIVQQRLRALPPPSISKKKVFRHSLEGLQEGDAVEVQWKGRRNHPFGWWFGRVHSLQDGSVTLEFMQYPRSSVWRRVKVPLNGAVGEVLVNGNAMFGYAGGLRRLTEEEAVEWKRHCPPHRVWEAQEDDGEVEQLLLVHGANMLPPPGGEGQLLGLQPLPPVQHLQQQQLAPTNPEPVTAEEELPEGAVGVLVPRGTGQQLHLGPGMGGAAEAGAVAHPPQHPPMAATSGQAVASSLEGGEVQGAQHARLAGPMAGVQLPPAPVLMPPPWCMWGWSVVHRPRLEVRRQVLGAATRAAHGLRLPQGYVTGGPYARGPPLRIAGGMAPSARGAAGRELCRTSMSWFKGGNSTSA